MKTPNHQPDLYLSSHEHDACGIGFIVNVHNRPSHDIVLHALLMLKSMEHRGGCGCDVNSGDGAGILIQKPHSFLLQKTQALGFDIGEQDQYGVAQVFLPKDEKQRKYCTDVLHQVIHQLGTKVLGIRAVPVDNHMLGEQPLTSEPVVEQWFIARATAWDLATFERKLFVIRCHASNLIRQQWGVEGDFYISSSSYKTLIYKGQFRTAQLRKYYRDLEEVQMTSALALVHSRFSTNTFPKWKLAQPFRYMAHNGEINTVKGNMFWTKAKQSILQSEAFTQEELNMIFPLYDNSLSDSANLDMMVEMLTLAGRSLPHVFMMLIPEAWQEYPAMEAYKKGFYRYHAHLMEPWDGPASICFTDGEVVGACLDRNGLRPSRYCLLDDGTLIMASEVGVLDIDPTRVVKRGRQQPGKIFLVDLKQQKIVSDDELKHAISHQQPYLDWVNNNEKQLSDFAQGKQDGLPPAYSSEQITALQQAFGYTSEDLYDVIAQLAIQGQEPVGSMGVDIALPILSGQTQHLSSYFKQQFAQVTNPPIDPIREKMVMSLHSYLGSSKSLLQETPEHARRILLHTPILTPKEFDTLHHIKDVHFNLATVSICWQADEAKGAFAKAIDRLCQEAIQRVRQGSNILILSDKSVDKTHVPIPSLLATSAVHHALNREGLRMNASLVVEAGDAWETHHFATLIAFGAHAVYPYLTFASIEHLRQHHDIFGQGASYEKLEKNYIKGIDYGLRKILSKLGISTVQSYHGTQAFEILGIHSQVVNQCFEGAVSRIEGMNFDDIAKEVLTKHIVAFPKMNKINQLLEVGGVYQWKRRGEYHLFNPDTIHLLQHSSRNNDYTTYKKYAHLINAQAEKVATLRGLLAFHQAQPIPIDEVEPIEDILKRFASGAMSFGSISHEAHTTLAIAMNRIGAKSNSGEGGEDPIRFEKKPNGDWERSAIKQVASGRFGVTSYYLANADELQIKIAQGAKPGEGGQLPGHKVNDWIARVRHSTPGVGLISPPPHHDIYSIEDLAQLIFDLKNANPHARISVKLVSGTGVGTIATGVAKGYADVVLIAGHDGGTGASPISSIRHAGLPWELGLAETHQTLLKNKLRNRIIVQADGQMKTGRDIVVATLLGAEEWGVATAALVVEGCILMRKCHLNTCPVGVATQDEELRKRFKGNPDHVVNFFRFLAQDVREIMAELGFRTIHEMVGRVDKLKMRDNIHAWKQQTINLERILHRVPSDATCTPYQSIPQPSTLAEQLDYKLLPQLDTALEHQKPVRLSSLISNQDRSAGSIISYHISKRHHGVGLKEDSIWIDYTGVAGQSFGAFAAPGLTMSLQGEANDYFGKGLSGGKLVLYPYRNAKYIAHQQIIVGNVCLYGATSGVAYISGIAGERFAVRNSGATAVVEGLGDHGCEYMTGGLVVVLGDVGRNFAAGMSGGMAYVFDEKQTFAQQCNTEMVDIEPMDDEDIQRLRDLVQHHFSYTQSPLAQRLLDQWDTLVSHFVKVMPREYKQVLKAKKKHSSKSIQTL